jgi:putative transposase
MALIGTSGEKVGPGASLGAFRADVLMLYLRLLPLAFFARLREQSQLRRQNNRIYNDAVVIWLMIVQRLHSVGVLETAVLELLRGLPQQFWPRPCKRLQDCAQDANSKLSSNTGSYNEARQQLPLTVVEHSADRVFGQLLEQVGGPEAVAGRKAFFLDGSAMRLPHNPTLAAHYPPGSNQHARFHWPTVRIVVAHDVYSGLAMRPQWGALYGEEAVSEQQLLEQAIQRLPVGSVVLGDANFGVFSTVWGTTRRGHPVALRLTAARAKALAGGPLRDGMDLRIRWEPSRDDRRSHPQLPPDAWVEGRLIVRQVHPSNGQAPFLLALFTTLSEEADSILELYGRRWHIETDLRSLKQTLRLDQLTSTTLEMVAKEIDVAMMAYNLVRAVICVAAQKADLPPRSFSFSRVRNVINAFAPLIASAGDPQKAQAQFDKMMYYVGQAQLPRRHRKRLSYPRAVWPQPRKYPKRKP